MSKVEPDPVGAALEKILAGDVRPPAERAPTKADLVDKYRDQLLTLKSKGWTWTALARQLTDLGLAVSPRTVQRQLIQRVPSPGKKTVRPPAKHGTTGATSDRAPADQTKAAAPAPKAKNAEPVGKPVHKTRTTETDFLTIKGDEL